MSQEIASMHAKISADSSGFESALGSIGSSLGGLGGIIGDLSIGGFFAASIGAASSAQQSYAQLGAVLKSTSGGNERLNEAMHMSRDALIDMAAGMEKTTRFSKDQTLSAEEMLLTFKTIGKDVFPSVTETALDMSQALGQDLKSSSMQLGKALEDPVKGISALTRVGVTFSEAQKQQIKSFQDSNQLAKAQGVILDELKSEFGGSATAAGQTFAGSLDILKNTFGELLEKIGDVFLPILTNVVTGITSVVDSITAANPNLLTFAGVAVIVGGALAAIPLVLGAIGGVLGVILSPIGAIVLAVIGLKVAFDNNFGGIRDTANNLIAELTPGFNSLKDLVSGFFGTLTGDSSQTITLAGAIKPKRQGGMQGMDDEEPGEGAGQQQKFDATPDIGSKLSKAVGDAWPKVQSAIATLAGNVSTWLTTEGPVLLASAVSTLMDWGDKIKDALPGITMGLGRLINKAVTWITNDGAKTFGEAIKGLFNMGQALIDALPKAIGDIGTFFTNLFAGKTDDKNNGFLTTVQGFVNGAIDWLVKTGKDLFVNTLAGFMDLDSSKVTTSLATYLAPFNTAFSEGPGLIATAISNGKGLIDGFIKKFDDIGTGLTSALKTIGDTLTKPFMDAIHGIGQLIQNVINLAPGIFVGLQPAATALMGAKAFGGPVGAGMSYLVGEKGPEIFTPGSSGNIIPNSALGRSGGSGGGGGNSIIISGLTINGVTDASKFLDELERVANNRNMKLQTPMGV